MAGYEDGNAAFSIDEFSVPISDVLNFTPGEPINQLGIFNESDYMSGSYGSDVLTGYRGADDIWGGSGDDLIRAGNGRDTIWGADGSDVLYGGLGKIPLHGRKMERLTRYLSKAINSPIITYANQQGIVLTEKNLMRSMN